MASALVALHSAFLGLGVGRTMRSADSSLTAAWLLAGAIAFGTGLWAAHLLGMLALHRDPDLRYGRGAIVFTWLACVAVAASAIWVSRAARPNAGPGWLHALAVGVGLALVHIAGLSGSLFDLAPWRVDREEAGWSGTALMALPIAGSALLSASAFRLMFRHRPTNATHEWTGDWPPAVAMGVGFSLAHLLQGVLFSKAPSVASGGLTKDSLESLVVAAVALMFMATALKALVSVRIWGASIRLTQSLEQARDGLQRVAHRGDALTGLPSRTAFEERLGVAVTKSARESTRLLVMYFNLDNFKPINDSFGHEVGDGVLRETAERLRLLSGAAGTLARVGGDEFVMLVEGDPDKILAAQLAARALESLSRPVGADGRDVSVSCSIGMVFFPDDGAQARLIAHANSAMSAAKRIGGSTYCFFEAAMDTDAREQVDLLRDLRRALERNQLELYYQPKIDTRSGQITGVEALLRWHHPTRGLVAPNVFVTVAERFGLIGALGNWVIEEALRQASAWRTSGLRMRVAINLSLHQLRQPDLAQRIAEATRRHGVQPSLITCEITESVAMEDTPATQRAFRRLTATGVKLSIDDFGTGYSSLSYLRKLSAQELKIDRSFVQDLDDSADSRAIVAAVVTLAHALGLNVVAEGVETEAQRNALRDLGCNQMQGYLFAKPMSAANLLAWASATTPSPPGFRDSLFVETAPTDLAGPAAPLAGPRASPFTTAPTGSLPTIEP